jgi:hypothetical protein
VIMTGAHIWKVLSVILSTDRKALLDIRTDLYCETVPDRKSVNKKIGSYVMFYCIFNLRKLRCKYSRAQN